MTTERAGLIGAERQTCPCCGQVEHSGEEPFSCCFVHYKTEALTRRTFIVCFECGHVWTRWSLGAAYRRITKEMGDGLLSRWWRSRWWRVGFCQECIHDF